MIRFVTTNAPALLKAVKAAIDAGHIETWSYDGDGDFTHTPPQWRSRAWLRPAIKADALEFGLLKPQGAVITREIYAIYHGRFVEMMLVHFDDRFDSAIASALTRSPDNF